MLSRVSLSLSLLVLLLALSACGAQPSESLVIYTSVDQPVSEPLLRDFQASTGIKVDAVYDVEASKTTGLVSRLAAERDRPRSDLFWSSEFAQTIALRNQGLLQPYQSPSASGIPQQFRDREGYWAGFAARARVILVNTKLVPPERYPRSLLDLLDPSWGQGEIGIANPLFGTTATQAAALFATLGDDGAKNFYLTLLQRQVRVVDGNSVVRDMVASGELKAGLTDTDDAQEAVSKGEPVKMIFPDQDPGPKGLGTLIIPNTLGLVKGAPHAEAAKKLIDYLLSPETEARLARSGTLQMPVRAGVQAPPEVPRLADLKNMEVSPEEVAQRLPGALAWLKESFLR